MVKSKLCINLDIADLVQLIEHGQIVIDDIRIITILNTERDIELEGRIRAAITNVVNNMCKWGKNK